MRWLMSGFLGFLFVLLVKALWPEMIPFDLFQFFGNGDIAGGVKASWPIFLWVIGITLVSAVFTLNSPHLNRNAEAILVDDFFRSAMAGLFEEALFRWIFFYSAVAAVQMANFFFFGFLGFGIAEFLHLYFFGPIVNFLTLGLMKWLIFGMGWAVGAGALAVNALFMEGHRDHGFFGCVNSWVIGFFLFWIMFNYGLWAAIIVHFLYDFFLYIVVYLDACVERLFGRV